MRVTIIPPSQSACLAALLFLLGSGACTPELGGGEGPDDDDDATADDDDDDDATTLFNSVDLTPLDDCDAVRAESLWCYTTGLDSLGVIGFDTGSFCDLFELPENQRVRALGAEGRWIYYAGIMEAGASPERWACRLDPEVGLLEARVMPTWNLTPVAGGLVGDVDLDSGSSASFYESWEDLLADSVSRIEEDLYLAGSSGIGSNGDVIAVPGPGTAHDHLERYDVAAGVHLTDLELNGYSNSIIGVDLLDTGEVALLADAPGTQSGPEISLFDGTTGEAILGPIPVSGTMSGIVAGLVCPGGSP